MWGLFLYHRKVISNGFERRDHFIQYDLECHGVAAALSGLEEITIAVPGSLGIPDRMAVILSGHGHGEIIKMDAIPFFGIPFCFFDLTNQSIIHFISLSEKIKRHA
jgi:hypothetical protein